MDVGRALNRNPLLSKRKQARRLRALLLALNPRPAKHEAIAAVARHLPAHLRLTVAEALPQTARHSIYGTTSPPPADPKAGPRRRGMTREPNLEDVADPARGPLDSQFGGKEATPAACNTVILLSHPDHQIGNATLLKAGGLDPLVVPSIESLKSQLAIAADVGGFVVDRSILGPLDRDQQRELVELLSKYSSFASIRLDGARLKLPHADVEQIVKQTRLLAADVAVGSVAFESDRTIRGAEVPRFKQASAYLRSQLETAFVLGDLSPGEAQLLVAAIRRQVDVESLVASRPPQQATLRILSGGQSGARLFSVEWHDTRTFVAKLTTKQRAREEVLRFRELAQDWYGHHAPTCHFHGDAGLLLSSLVRRGANPGLPALSLEEALTDLWNDEWMRQDHVLLAEDMPLVGGRH